MLIYIFGRTLTSLSSSQEVKNLKKCFVFTLSPEEFDDLDLILKVVGGQIMFKIPRFHHVSRRD